MSTDEARMTFTEHLRELRTRLIRSVAAMGIGIFVCYFFCQDIFYLVARPLMPIHQTAAQQAKDKTTSDTTQPAPAQPQTPAAPFSTPGGGTTVDGREFHWTTMTPMDGFWIQLRLGIYAGLLLALPYVIYQIIGFVLPGLKSTEKRVVFAMLFGGAGLAVLGVSVAYFGVMPLVLPYVMSWNPPEVLMLLDMDRTVMMVLWFYLGFAIAFQFPMGVVVLVYLGLLTPQALQKHWRVLVIVIALLSAILTPPDPISMTVMMVPLLVLFGISIIAAHMVVRMKKKRVAGL